MTYSRKQIKRKTKGELFELYRSCINDEMSPIMWRGFTKSEIVDMIMGCTHADEVTLQPLIPDDDTEDVPVPADLAFSTSPAIIDCPQVFQRNVDISQHGDTTKLEIRRRIPGERGRGPIILVLNPHVPPGGDWSHWTEGSTLRIKIDLPLDRCSDSP